MPYIYKGSIFGHHCTCWCPSTERCLLPFDDVIMCRLFCSGLDMINLPDSQHNAKHVSKSMTGLSQPHREIRGLLGNISGECQIDFSRLWCQPKRPQQISVYLEFYRLIPHHKETIERLCPQTSNLVLDIDPQEGCLKKELITPCIHSI